MCVLESEYGGRMPRKKPLPLWCFAWENCSLTTHPVRSCQDKIRVVILHTSLYPGSTASFDINRRFFSRKGMNMWLQIALWCFICQCTHAFVYFQRKNECLPQTLVLKNLHGCNHLNSYMEIICKPMRNLRSHNDVTLYESDLTVRFLTV